MEKYEIGVYGRKNPQVFYTITDKDIIEKINNIILNNYKLERK